MWHLFLKFNLWRRRTNTTLAYDAQNKNAQKRPLWGEIYNNFFQQINIFWESLKQSLNFSISFSFNIPRTEYSWKLLSVGQICGSLGEFPCCYVHWKTSGYVPGLRGETFAFHTWYPGQLSIDIKFDVKQPRFQAVVNVKWTQTKQLSLSYIDLFQSLTQKRGWIDLQQNIVHKK